MPPPWKCSRPGWTGLWEPGLVEGVPAHSRAFVTRWSVRSFLTQTVLWFYQRSGEGDLQWKKSMLQVLLSLSCYREDIHELWRLLLKYRKNQRKTRTKGMQNWWLTLRLAPAEEKNNFHSYKESKDKDIKKNRSKAQSIIQNHSDLLIYYSVFAIVGM